MTEEDTGEQLVQIICSMKAPECFWPGKKT